MSDDYDKREWQAEQAARDAALEEQRAKYAKARERSARNAQRKLERLRRKLTEEGEISDFETEFADSVRERLNKFGSAFSDPQLGRPGDALSSAQKRVVAGMNRKVKDLKKKACADVGGEGGDDLERPRYSGRTPRSSFKRKGKPGWTPRVRQLDEEFEPDDAASDVEPDETEPAETESDAPRPPVGRPFLRIVRND